jgi:hypothetical protein
MAMNDFKRNFVDPHARHDARMQFILRLRPEPECEHPISALKRVLKFALRSCGLRCVEVRKEDAS